MSCLQRPFPPFESTCLKSCMSAPRRCRLHQVHWLKPVSPLPRLHRETFSCSTLTHSRRPIPPVRHRVGFRCHRRAASCPSCAHCFSRACLRKSSMAALSTQKDWRGQALVVGTPMGPCAGRRRSSATSSQHQLTLTLQRPHQWSSTSCSTLADLRLNPRVMRHPHCWRKSCRRPFQPALHVYACLRG